jgi:organic hydroperoxide reductase OsmC/OhrA
MAIRHRVHRYRTTLRWRGSTGAGYAAYSRAHTATATPAEVTLTLASDPAFRGDPRLLNPEQLVVIAASSCQLLSFLAIAARAGVEVLEYEDDAEGTMPEDDEPVRIASIVLRPRIAVAAGVDPDRVVAFCEQAHHECYVANSLRTEVRVEPEIVVQQALAVGSVRP